MRTNPLPPDRRLIYLLSVAQRRVQRFIATQRGGATPAQSGLLFVLGRQDGLSMGEAGAALDLGLPGISGLAERMMEGGTHRKARRSRRRPHLAAVADGLGAQGIGARESERRRHQYTADGRIYRS